MAKIKKIKDHAGKTEFPVTVADAVLMGDGTTLKGKLSELGSEVFKNFNKASNATVYDDSVFTVKDSYITSGGIASNGSGWSCTDFIELPSSWTKLIYKSKVSEGFNVAFYSYNKKTMMSKTGEINGYDEIDKIDNAKYVRMSWYKAWGVPFFAIKTTPYNVYMDKNKVNDYEGLMVKPISLDDYCNDKVRFIGDGTFTSNDYCISTDITPLPSMWERIEISLWMGSMNALLLFDEKGGLVKFISDSSHVVITSSDYPSAKYYAVTALTSGVGLADSVGYIYYRKDSLFGYKNESLFRNIDFPYQGLLQGRNLVNNTNFCTTDFIYLGDWNELYLTLLKSSASGASFYDENKYYIKTVYNNFTYTGAIRIKREDCFRAQYVRFSRNVNKDEGFLNILQKLPYNRFLEESAKSKVLSKRYMDSETSVETMNLFTPENCQCAITRVPSIATVGDVVIAACQCQQETEDKGAMDISIRRLIGDVWGDVSTLLQSSETNGRYMNPSFVVTPSGRIYLFAAVVKNNDKFAVNCTTEELDSVYVYSDNNGESWSNPTSVKAYWGSGYTAALPAPANGIYYDGKICVPCMYVVQGAWRSGLMIMNESSENVVFSAYTDTLLDNECTVFERNGDIVLNCRNDRGGMFPFYRNQYVYNSDDNSLVEEYDYFRPLLRCQSMITKSVYNGKTIYLRTFPDGADARVLDGGFGARINNTLWISEDCKKWVYAVKLTEHGGYVSHVLNGETFYAVCENATTGISELVSVNVKTIIPDCLYDGKLTDAEIYCTHP